MISQVSRFTDIINVSEPNATLEFMPLSITFLLTSEPASNYKCPNVRFLKLDLTRKLASLSNLSVIQIHLLSES